MNKHYVTANALTELSTQLSAQILDSNWKPTWIVALWRGGAYIGTVVQEHLKWHGIKTDHIAVRTSRFTRPGEVKEEIDVFGLNYIVKNANADDRLLIVDDVFESGLSIEAVKNKLKTKMRANYPQVKVATVFYKSEKRVVDFEPDWYVEKSTAWIVFPHEVEEMSKEEIALHKGSEIAQYYKQ